VVVGQAFRPADPASAGSTPGGSPDPTDQENLLLACGIKRIHALNRYSAFSIGTPSTSMRLRSVVPTPCSSASSSVLSQLLNGADFAGCRFPSWPTARRPEFGFSFGSSRLASSPYTEAGRQPKQFFSDNVTPHVAWFLSLAMLTNTSVSS